MINSSIQGSSSVDSSLKTNLGITKYRYSFDEAKDWTIVDVRKNRKMNRAQAGIENLLLNIDKSKNITTNNLIILNNKFLLIQKFKKRRK